MTVRTPADRGAAARHSQRASGQLAPMIAARQPFAEVAQQLPAARGPLDSLLVRLVELELNESLPSCELPAEVRGLLRTALARNVPQGGSFASGRKRGGTSHVVDEERMTR